MKKVFNLTALLALILLTFSAEAQIKTPAASPGAKVSQSVGLTEISVNYSRPAMKGRAVFGNLVPFGKAWRLGANGSTLLTLGSDAKVGGADVAAGTYAVYAIPGESEWEVVLNKALTNGGNTSAYKNEDDAARVKVKSSSTEASVESFTIAFENVTDGSLDMVISWEKTSVSIPVVVNTDAAVEAQIERFAKNPNAGVADSYWGAGTYYLNTEGKDKKKALEWINKGLEARGGEAPFWMLRAKSLAQAANKDYKGALKTAKESLDAAKKAGNEDYVKMNTESIAEWMKK